jgi:hypothetical protein
LSHTVNASASANWYGRSSRVWWVIVVTPLLGTHWSYRPAFHAACESFQPCGGSGRKVRPRSRTAGRNGNSSPEPFGWYQTLLPDGSVTGCGSANPRTPRSVPK